MEAGINYLAVLAAAVSAFVLGGLWYSPVLFHRQWLAASGLTAEQAQAGHPAMVFGVSFVLSLVAAFVFAMFLGPQVTLTQGLFYGFSAGLFWVAASFGINYLFERKPFRLWLINGGYHTVQFTLYGLILGAWH
jgi:hypothetical protein